MPNRSKTDPLELQKELDRAIRSKDPARIEELLLQGVSFEELSLRETVQLWEVFFRSANPKFGALLLDTGFDIEAWEKKNGSLLCFAVGRMEKPKETLTWFVENGGDPNAAQEAHGTPLNAALRADRPDVYRALLEVGADLHHANQRADRFWNSEATYQLTPDELATLGAVYPPKILNNDVVLFACAAGADRDVLAQLKSLGAPIDDPDEDDKRTALHWCVENRWKAQVTALLELGADPLKKDRRRRTPFDLARGKKGFKTVIAQMEKFIDAKGAPPRAKELPLDCTEPWADALVKAVAKLKGKPAQSWQTLLTLTVEASSSRPSKTFVEKTTEAVDGIGADRLRRILVDALPKYRLGRSATSEGDIDDDRYEFGDGRWATTEINGALLRGLLWVCARFPDAEMSAVLRDIATAAFKKVPYVGLRNAKVGNAALNALAEMGEVGVRQIAILREQTKYNAAKVNIDRVFERVGKDLEISTEELSENSMSDFGLTECGTYCDKIGAHTALLTIQGPGRTDLEWRKGEKTQKTVPVVVKRDHAESLRSLKVLEKDLQKATLALRDKLERQYIQPTTWAIDTWRERYLDHPVGGSLGRRLIWRFEGAKGKSFSAMPVADGFVDAQGSRASMKNIKSVELWHPLHAEVPEVLAWRGRLVESGTVQPFKQAHREVYLVTAAEKKTRNHSLRFAGHILHQAQAHALASQRGWSQHRGGRWDGGQETDFGRLLESAGLDVSYSAEPLEDLGTSDTGIYLYLSTGRVSFRKLRKSGDAGAAVSLAKVPPLVFSEIMRDLDLFVSVANAGNDPEWEHRATIQDWEAHTVGELHESGVARREVLEELLPKLAIAKRLSIDGRYLRVQGQLAAYRIHLGSGNVIMDNGHYLCIVRRRSANRGVVLPFEGDGKLSEILSKALMLAADHKIKDATIRSQIGS